MKKLLWSIMLLPLTVVSYEEYGYGSDAPEIQFINAAKSYVIQIGYDIDDANKVVTLPPRGRSGSVQLPTEITDDGKFKSTITLSAFSTMPDVNNANTIEKKKYEITFDRQFGKPIRTEAPAIIINYSKGFFGNAGFDLKGSALVNNFTAKEESKGDESAYQGQHIKPAFFNKTY